MSDESAQVQENAANTSRAVARFAEPRIPYHPLVEERFGIDRAGWRALQDAVWPGAKTADAMVLALSYCKARRLDPFKKPVHIVPIWSRELGRMTESVWPGIGELRTTAFRTGLYAGRDKPEYGPKIDDNLGGIEISYPEWCEITVYRIGSNGQRMPFPGPRVYWIETYATAKRDTAVPNDMWRRRPFGQLEKCAEAAALRAAFPEEVGNEYTAEEMAGQVVEHIPAAEQPKPEPRANKLDRFEQKHAAEQTPKIEFEVIDYKGFAFITTDLNVALNAYHGALKVGEDEAGEKGLTAVWDANQGFMRLLDENSRSDLTEQFSRDYGLRRQAAAAREKDGQDRAMAHPNGAAAAGEKAGTAATEAADRQGSSEATAEGKGPAAPSSSQPEPDAKTLELIAAGDKVAETGTVALGRWWSSLSSAQRGFLGARGRGSGEHYKRWFEIAKKVDASNKASPPPAAKAPSAEEAQPQAQPSTAPAEGKPAVDPESKPPEASGEADDGARSSSEADPADRDGGIAEPGHTGEAGGSPAPERDPIWGQEDFTVETPIRADTGNTNFQLLRDTLAKLVAEAMTEPEREKFMADNAVNLRRLGDAFPNYNLAVIAAANKRKAEIAKG